MKQESGVAAYAKQASAIQHPCDTGNLHIRERHHSKTVSLSDLREMNLLNVIAEQLQHFRDIGELNICAKTMEHIVNMGIRMPTILQKSCDSKSLQKAFFVPGILDSSQQGPDFDRIVATYKKQVTVELKKQIEDEAPLQIKEFRRKGRFIEESFDDYNHPTDHDSDGQEHPLSVSFALQHHRQRCTMLTNEQVIGDFAAAFSGADEPATAQENARNERADEMRWRDQILNENASYESKLVKAAGRSLDDPPELLRSDLQDGQLPNHILSSIAKLRGECKSFVLARCVTSKNDPAFKE